jgi:hypothetical protein
VPVLQRAFEVKLKKQGQGEFGWLDSTSDDRSDPKMLRVFPRYNVNVNLTELFHGLEDLGLVPASLKVRLGDSK